MALKRSDTYPGRFNAPTTAHPQGAFKNRSAPGAQDGSYLEAAWANDWDGFFARILNLAGVTPNGTADTGTSSQLYDALLTLVQARDATLTALAGLTTGADKLPYFTGTDTAGQTDLSLLARTLLGNTTTVQMRTTLGLGDASTKTVGAGSLTSLPDMSFFRGGMTANGYLKVPVIGAGGGAQTFVLQWGVQLTLPSSNSAYNLNIAFPTSILWATGGRGAPGSSQSMNVGPEGTQQIRIQNVATGVSENCFWLAIGY